jgi:hypothetical protein
MPHHSSSTHNPAAATFLTISTSRHCQAATYPNKPIPIIKGFALGGRAGSPARILYSKPGEAINQSTALESLLAQSECELLSNLINTINYTAQ